MIHSRPELECKPMSHTVYCTRTHSLASWHGWHVSFILNAHIMEQLLYTVGSHALFTCTLTREHSVNWQQHSPPRPSPAEGSRGQHTKQRFPSS